MRKVTIIHGEAVSARMGASEPFLEAGLNQSYAHFITRGREKGMDVTVAHYNEYEAGSVSLGWTYNGSWHTKEDVTIDFVYDMSLFRNEQTVCMKKDLQERDIGVMNHPDLWMILKDKQMNFESFPEIIPASVAVRGSVDDMSSAIESLRRERLHPDLDTGLIMMKPRYGYAGRGIMTVNSAYDGLRVIENEDYVAQPFLETIHGIPELGIEGRHDFRAVVVNGHPRIAYARFPAKNRLISNVTAGGDIRYFGIEDIPQPFMELVEEVDSGLAHFSPRIYSVDMAVGKSGRSWAYELNGEPGLPFDANGGFRTPHTKKLQEAILDAIIQEMG
jgi:hypothetical protein